MATTNTIRPVGTLTGTFEELHAAGCIQTGADAGYTAAQAKREFGKLFVDLQIATRGNFCDGCPEFRNGSCPAFKKYHTSRMAAGVVRNVAEPKVEVKPTPKPIRVLARELGISINEVQRRRDRGEL